MKSRFTKIAAAAMALTMCVPTGVLAAEEGSFETSFDVYSPALTVSVPVNLDVEVNPIADTGTSVKQFTVASNNIDILNASVDVDADVAIPVVATVKASITSSAEGVITKYNSFTADTTSTKKKIYLALSEGTSGAVTVKDGGTAAFDDTTNKLKLDQYTVAGASYAAAPTNTAPITKFGSLLSLDIVGPTSTDSTAGKTFSTDATKITPAVKSFAVTGVANANADWQADDVKVAVTYNVKASQALSIKTPTLAAAPTVTEGSDLTITLPNMGETTVLAMGVHNDDETYAGQSEFLWTDGLEAVSAPNGTTPTQTDITITIDKDDAALAYLADNFDGEAQDLVIALSDGRYIVSTLTVNAAATP